MAAGRQPLVGHARAIDDFHTGERAPYPTVFRENQASGVAERPRSLPSLPAPDPIRHSQRVGTERIK